MEIEILTVNTTKGELQYYRDWDRMEGGIVMKNAQTINRYKEIKNQHPDGDECGVFFAFSRDQFSKGYNRLVELGHIKDGEKVCQDSETGAYGTKSGLDKFFQFYIDREKQIPTECDPQEVYFYEYNNHECMFAWDGDKEAVEIIIRHWGKDVAKSLKRYNASKI